MKASRVELHLWTIVSEETVIHKKIITVVKLIVTFLVGLDPYKLLSQVVSYIHVTVHKQPDWMVD